MSSTVSGGEPCFVWFTEYMYRQCQNNRGAHMYVEYTGSTRHV